MPATLTRKLDQLLVIDYLDTINIPLDLQITLPG